MPKDKKGIKGTEVEDIKLMILNYKGDSEYIHIYYILLKKSKISPVCLSLTGYRPKEDTGYGCLFPQEGGQN